MQVSGPRTGAVTLVVAARKLPAAWPRMAVYDPRAGGAGVYVCKNTDRLTCHTMPVATLVRVVGIDPFPGPPDQLKREAMAPATAGG